MLTTKREVLEAALRGEGILGRCADDEPVFVLCGRDIAASETIMEWCDVRTFYMRQQLVFDAAEQSKVEQAKQVARACELWHDAQKAKGTE